MASSFNVQSEQNLGIVGAVFEAMCRNETSAGYETHRDKDGLQCTVLQAGSCQEGHVRPEMAGLARIWHQSSWLFLYFFLLLEAWTS